MRGIFHLAGLLWDGHRDSQTVMRLQASRLRSFLRRAYEEVPYYGRLFRSCRLEPDDIRGPADLYKIPITTKQQFRAMPLEEKVSRRVIPSRCRRVTTSGSSGLPLVMYFSKSDMSTMGMTWARAMLACGVRPRERRLEIIGPHNVSNRKKWYNYLGLWNAYGISALEDPEEWIRAWRRHHPDILWGYSGSLKLLAQHALRSRVSDLRPRLIFGVSDTVEPDCRELVLEAFKTNLIDLYGAAETGLIAWECPTCSAYHLNSDTLVVEFLQNGGPVSPGGRGSIVVTNLYSRAMPILRYELGDVGIPSGVQPSCGWGLPLMEAVLGRDDDCIVLPSGKRLSPMFSFCIMKPLQGIERFRVVQRKTGALAVLIVPSAEFPPDGAGLVRRRWEENLDERLDIEVAIVDRLPQLPSGKTRCTISEVSRAT